jgi:dimethylargininase
MFSRAIVRLPCENMVHGLRSADRGSPCHTRALAQHEEYVKALVSCGLEVTVLEPDNDHPDSTFVEDTVLATPHFAVITNPGVPERRGETAGMAEVISRYYRNVEFVEAPGTIDGGDVLTVGSHCYIGLSGRTNLDGARQLIRILGRFGMTGSYVTLNRSLHLKSGAAFLDNNVLVAGGEFLSKREFRSFRILEVDDEEIYAANCLLINGNVLVAEGYPGVKRIIEEEGYPTMEVDVSEFRKIDGGLSCLSVRF